MKYILFLLFSLNLMAEPNILFNNGTGFDNHKYTRSTDFPNTSNLYGWRPVTSSGSVTWETVFGGINLSVGSASFVSQSDQLNYATFNEFSSDDYLTSTNAAFDGTGAFSVSAWVHRSNWATDLTTNSTIASNYNGSVGWIVFFFPTNDVFILQVNNQAPACQTPIGNLKTGWHHFAAVYGGVSSTQLYVDGTLACSSAVTQTAMTSAVGDFEVGGFNGANGRLGSSITHRMSDVWHQSGAWTAAEVNKLYARGASVHGITATVQQNGEVVAPPPQNFGVMFPTTLTFNGSGGATGQIQGSVIKTDGVCEFSIQLQNATTGTSSNTFSSITGAVPLGYRPLAPDSGNSIFPVAIMNSSTAQAAPGVAILSSGGTITVYRDYTFGGLAWTNASTSGGNGWNLNGSYRCN